MASTARTALLHLLCAACLALGPTCQVEVLPDFTTSRYSGVFCGVTVFTVVAALEGQTPFHSITMPLVDTLNRMGISTYVHHGRVHHQYVAVTEHVPV